jgi:serine O-acetyltransferase
MPQDKTKPKQFEAYGQPVEGCPDPVLRTIEDLRGQVARLIERVDELEARQGLDADVPAPDTVKPAATGRS